MPRLQLVEIEDQPWCPSMLRDATTGMLELVLRVGNCYAAILPRLIAALRETRTDVIVDLCSGGGGPWPGLIAQLEGEAPIRVTLTDRFPNTDAARRFEGGASKGRIELERRSVDAREVPGDLNGFRTMFTAFHHFKPDDAHAILADACRRRVGIGVFEFTERSVVAIFAFLFVPFAVLVGLPFLRPFRWRWLLLTYVLPLIPLMALFDGLVSCLRTHSPAELRELVGGLKHEDYVWEIGQVRSWRSPVPITHLIGHPAKQTPTAWRDGARAKTSHPKD